jgi:hypothetical protein
MWLLGHIWGIIVKKQSPESVIAGALDLQAMR